MAQGKSVRVAFKKVMIRPTPAHGSWRALLCRASVTSGAPSPKSSLYTNLLPLLNSNRIELLDHPRLAAQLCGLERRTARGGRDSIDHAPAGHDDLANAVAGAAL